MECRMFGTNTANRLDTAQKKERESRKRQKKKAIESHGNRPVTLVPIAKKKTSVIPPGLPVCTQLVAGPCLFGKPCFVFLFGLFSLCLHLPLALSLSLSFLHLSLSLSPSIFIISIAIYFPSHLFSCLDSCYWSLPPPLGLTMTLAPSLFQR